MKKICLGTVFQGMQYGISGDTRPTLEQSLSFFEEAVDMGVSMFDTAPQYGDAEEILGMLRHRIDDDKEISIVSKLRHGTVDNIEVSEYAEHFHKEINLSLNRLHADKLYGYMFHSAEYIHDKNAVKAMSGLKDEGRVDNIGVSVYTPHDALVAVNIQEIDIIQIPYNILDTRLDRTDFFDIARRNKKRIFVRSVFLQGLLLMNPKDVPSNLTEAVGYLEDIRSETYGMPLSEVCLAFCVLHEGIDHIVVGARGADDLRENLSGIKKADRYDDVCRELRMRYTDVNEILINPTKW